MEKLIKETRRDGVRMILVISPAYGVLEQKFKSEYAPAFSLCHKYDVPIMDNSINRLFMGKDELFQDKTHLNHDGAILFSQIMASQIKNHIKEQHSILCGL